MHSEHGLILIQSEMDEIKNAVEQDVIRANDCKWFVLFVLTIVIFGGWIMLHECKNVPDNYQKVADYTDSLQGFVDTANGVHVIVER